MSSSPTRLWDYVQRVRLQHILLLFSAFSQDDIVAHGANSQKRALLQALVYPYLTALIINYSL